MAHIVSCSVVVIFFLSTLVSPFFPLPPPTPFRSFFYFFKNPFHLISFLLCANNTDIFRRADLFEISNILNTGLDRETLSILLNLCEAGVHPEALAAVVKELRREAAAVQLEEEASETTTA